MTVGGGRLITGWIETRFWRRAMRHLGDVSARAYALGHWGAGEVRAEAAAAHHVDAALILKSGQHVPSLFRERRQNNERRRQLVSRLNLISVMITNPFAAQKRVR
jgi:hypothetical protein